MYSQTPSACAIHHERPASNTCTRCGTFMCLECRRFGPNEQIFCAECLKIAVPSSSARHMTTIGILMMVHGGLLCAMGLFFLIAAIFFPAMFFAMPPPKGGAAPPPEAFFAIIAGVYGVMALCHLVPGVMQIIGGNKARRLKSRGFVIASLATGLASLFGFYCAPTSIALFVVGLVYLLKADVTDAFRKNEASDA